jgi:hypothetical protein
MLKYHKFISFCWGLLFLIVVQKFAAPQPIFRFLVPAFLVYAAAVAIYNRWYLKTIQKYNFWTILRSLLLLAAAFGIFFFLPSGSLRGLFLISAVAVITFFQMIIGLSAENLLLNETLIIAFGLFCAFFGAYYAAPGFEVFYLAGIFFSATLLSRSFYEFVPKSSEVKLISSLVIGLFSSELFWCLNFLQFHFSVLALILLNVFYFCLMLNYYYFFHILNFKKIQFHLFLILACVVIVLLATPWVIIRQ